MKNYLFIALLFISFVSFGQNKVENKKVSLVIGSGLSFSKVRRFDYVQNHSYAFHSKINIPAFNIGFIKEIGLKSSILVELNFSQYSFIENVDSFLIDYNMIKNIHKNNYLGIPISYFFQHKSFYASGGLDINYLISRKIKTEETSIKSSKSYNDGYSTLENSKLMYGVHFSTGIVHKIDSKINLITGLYLNLTRNPMLIIYGIELKLL